MRWKDKLYFLRFGLWVFVLMLFASLEMYIFGMVWVAIGICVYGIAPMIWVIIFALQEHKSLENSKSSNKQH